MCVDEAKKKRNIAWTIRQNIYDLTNIIGSSTSLNKLQVVILSPQDFRTQSACKSMDFLSGNNIFKEF